MKPNGGMAEWTNALAWSASILARVSWVRIPVPPPLNFVKVTLNYVLCLYIN